jgi:hypothetical protein
MADYDTPERREVFMPLYQAGETYGVILREVNRLPAPAPLKANSISSYAKKLRIVRPGKSAVRAQTYPKSSIYRSPEREAIILEHYNSMKSTREILELLNAAPGRRPMNAKDLSSYASTLRIHRPDGFNGGYGRRDKDPIPGPVLHPEEMPIAFIARWARVNAIEPLTLSAVTEKRIAWGLPPYVPAEPIYRGVDVDLTQCSCSVYE